VWEKEEGEGGGEECKLARKHAAAGHQCVSGADEVTQATLLSPVAGSGRVVEGAGIRSSGSVELWTIAGQRDDLRGCESHVGLW
jgi:hypothetical protein